MLANPENVCPRCKERFICKADDIHQCDCKKVQLDEDVIKQLAANYQNCLCLSCLKELQSGKE